MSYLPGTILEYNRGGVISSVMVLTNGKAYLSPHPDKEVMSSKPTVELADWLLFANGKEKIRVPASPTLWADVAKKVSSPCQLQESFAGLHETSAEVVRSLCDYIKSIKGAPQENYATLVYSLQMLTRLIAEIKLLHDSCPR